MPIRVQLSRKKGWRMPENTVSVARPTRWGNPYRACLSGPFTDEECVRLYEQTVRGLWSPVMVQGFIEYTAQLTYERHVEFRARFQCHPLEAVRAELRGKNLACWCSLDSPCHADVLLDIANSGQREVE